MYPVEERELYKKVFIWEDAINELEESQRDLFYSLPQKIKTKLMDVSEKSIRNGLEGGLMHDWDYVMRIAIDGSGMFKQLEGLSVLVSDPGEDDMWNHSFQGTIKEFEDEYFVVEDQDGNAFDVPYDKVKFLSEDGDSTDLQAKTNVSTDSTSKRRFIVAVTSEYLRDAQAATSSEDQKWEDNKHWWDFTGDGILEIMDAVNSEEAIKATAAKYEISEEILTTYEIVPTNNQITVNTPNGVLTAHKEGDTGFPGIIVEVDGEAAALVEYDSCCGQVYVRSYKQYGDEPYQSHAWGNGPRRINDEDRVVVYLKDAMGNDVEKNRCIATEVLNWYDSVYSGKHPVFIEYLALLDDEVGILSIAELTHPGCKDSVENHDVKDFAQAISMYEDLCKIVPCKPVGFDVYIGEGTGKSGGHELCVFTPYGTSKDEYIKRLEIFNDYLSKHVRAECDE